MDRHYTGRAVGVILGREPDERTSHRRVADICLLRLLKCTTRIPQRQVRSPLEISRIAKPYQAMAAAGPA
jgi:hypothetical protein